jgi:peroxiredoxin (alkyl hydroperoxide reductase subunit C)
VISNNQQSVISDRKPVTGHWSLVTGNRSPSESKGARLMRTVGENFPEFRLQAVVGLEPGREFQEVTLDSHPGRWKVVFFWPMDFTFVCPTEIAEFGQREADFAERSAQVLGVSTDTHYVHLAWRKDHPDLRDLPFPMLADTKRELSTALGILHPEEGVPLRATFIVDPEGVIRYASANDRSVGRNVDEVLRVLDALQTGELCPCNWRRGEPTLQVA